MNTGLVSKITRGDMQRASWIRRMFEKGAQLKLEHGADKVFDYSLGNPSFPLSPLVQQKLITLAGDTSPGIHSYMSNAGFEEVRRKIAACLSTRQGLTTPLTTNRIVMTCGAAGALNVIFESILNEGDEVIVPTPYFVEYGFYVDRHRGKLVPVKTKTDFQLNLEAIAEAITPRTKAILINSPHNPTGAVYSRESLQKLQEVIARKEQEFNHEILLISDEPYAKIVYDGVEVPPILQVFPHSLLVTSHSKDLSLAGERIGYAAINPLIPDSAELFSALLFNNRILGFVNAPAIMQRLVAELQDEVVGLPEYQARRDLLYNTLTKMGYKIVKPQGAFYMFPQSPIPDDVSFCSDAAQKHLLLLVPASGFGTPGYFRISFSTIEIDQIQRSLPAFQALAREYNLR